MTRFITLFALILALSPGRATLGAESKIAGRWEWKGKVGWQRLVLDLQEDRGKITGTILMGPGPGNGSKREDLWEYFFNPVEFEVSKGNIKEDNFFFEQEVLTHVQSNATATPWYQ